MDARTTARNLRCLIRALVTVACGALLGKAAFATGADGYPVKPVRLIVGFSPSGGGDIVARIVAAGLSRNLKQSVIVDNRPGAGGSIGAAAVVNSAPDGYSLLVVTSSYAVMPALYKELAFDPMKDLAPVSLIAEAPLLLAVHPSLPARTVKELIELARARPGELNYGSGGNGTSGHLAGEQFKHLAGVNIVHVPYKGAGPAMVDAIAGQVQVTFSSVLSSLPHVKAGRLRVLAVTTPKRSSAFPDIPTVAESGVNGYRRTTWYGMLAPSRTPAPIIDLLGAEIAKTVSLPDVRQRLMADGAEPASSTSKEFHDYLVSEMEIAGKIMSQAGARR